MQLGAARIFVRDIVEAKAFYSDRLGLSVEAADLENGFCMFDTGATKLIVEAIGADDEQGRELVGRFTGLSFPVSDIQAKYRELTALGVTFAARLNSSPGEVGSRASKTRPATVSSSFSGRLERSARSRITRRFSTWRWQRSSLVASPRTCALREMSLQETSLRLPRKIRST